MSNQDQFKLCFLFESPVSFLYLQSSICTQLKTFKYIMLVLQQHKAVQHGLKQWFPTGGSRPNGSPDSDWEKKKFRKMTML